MNANEMGQGHSSERACVFGENARVISRWRFALGIAVFGALALCGSLASAQTAEFSRAVFDHSLFDSVLKKHVTEDGLVDYKGLQQAPGVLDEYIDSLSSASLDDLPPGERLTLLINAYNAFTLRLILDHYPVQSIHDIRRRDRWSNVRWQIGGNTWSLDQIEHAQIRPKHREPRIHFALVCAALGCPTLRNEAYQPQRLNDQLEEQTQRIHKDPRWFRYDSKKKTVSLTKLYKWYGEDFEKATATPSGKGSVLAFAARYVPELAKDLSAKKKPRIEWLSYDWKLNDKNPVSSK